MCGDLRRRWERDDDRPRHERTRDGYTAGDGTFVEWDGRGMASRMTPTARAAVRTGRLRCPRRTSRRWRRGRTRAARATGSRATRRWTGPGSCTWAGASTYVGNSPLSRTDPTGYCYAAGPLCQVAGGGGFTNVTQTLTSWSMSWIPVYATITRGRVSFGIGRSFWNGEDGGFFGRGGFFRPRVSFRIGLPFPVFTSMARMVSLGQESSPADLRIVGAVGAGGKLEEALRTTRVY